MFTPFKTRHTPVPSITLDNARDLRRSLTDAERKLWYVLRNREFAGVKFRRQHPVGSFIVDFCCIEHHLVVELDGSQHAEHREKDEQRTRYLEAEGYRVLRFWNEEILANLDNVLEQISQSLNLCS